MSSGKDVSQTGKEKRKQRNACGSLMNCSAGSMEGEPIKAKSGEIMIKKLLMNTGLRNSPESRRSPGPFDRAATSREKNPVVIKRAYAARRVDGGGAAALSQCRRDKTSWEVCDADGGGFSE